MFQKNKKNILIAFNLFIFSLSVYLLTSAGSNFYHMDASQLRIQVVQSVIERSDLAVPEGLKGADGRNYSWFGIGSALLAVPFYLLGKLTGDPGIAVSTMNQFTSAATVVLIFLFSITLDYSKRASLFVSILYGLGTIAWPLAKQPFDNPVETFFILLSVYCTYLYVLNRKVSHLLFSSIALGFAFITRPTSILVIPPLFVLMIISLSKESDFKATLKLMTRNVVLFSLALLPFLCLFFWYNYYRFGSVFETGYQLIAARTGVEFFTGTSLLTGLRGFLISPGKGFFYYSPVAILFFFSIKPFMKKHFRLGISLIFIMVSYLLFLSKYAIWHGDWAWGPRLIFVITPLLIMPIAEIIDSNTWIKKKFLRVIICSIFTVSVIIQIAAVSVDFQKYFYDLQIKKKVKFTETYGDGVLPWFQPPEQTYFDWHRSPILAQFKFIYKTTKEIKDYRYLELPDNAKRSEKIMASPYMNVYDFWWLYNYIYSRTYSGFIAALVLFLLAIYTAVKMWELSN